MSQGVVRSNGRGVRVQGGWAAAELRHIEADRHPLVAVIMSLWPPTEPGGGAGGGARIGGGGGLA